MCAEPDLRKWLARLLACLRHLRNDTIVSASWYAPVVMLNNALQQDSTDRSRVPHLSRGPVEAPPGPTARRPVPPERGRLVTQALLAQIMLEYEI